MDLENNDNNSADFFCHLSLQSDFSLLESSIQFKQLAKHLKKLDYKVAALTDTNALFGIISFQSVMLENNIKPIIGIRLTVRYGNCNGYVLLYAKNKEGYKNLCYISSLTYLNKAENDKLFFPFEDLTKYSDGLVCITGGIGSLLENIYFNNISLIDETLILLSKCFKEDFYIEIEHYGLDYQDKLNEFYTQISKPLNISLVATNNCRFLHPDHYEAHDAMLALKSEASIKTILRERVTTSHYVKSKDEMFENFKNKSYFTEDLFKNTKIIADKCNFVFKKERNFMPEFPLPEGFTDEKEYFVFKVKEGWNDKIKHILLDRKKRGKLKYGFDVYKKRLQEEVEVISKMGFAGYFLVVADYINWAKDRDIPVGISRGSVGGSIVAYCLGIINIDPVQYDLYFERFINVERFSLPDIDTDFEASRRDEVIGYVAEKYGYEHVCKIITFGTLAAKAAVKDMGRVNDVDYKEMESVCKKMLETVRGINPKIKESVEKQQELINIIKSDPLLQKVFNQAQVIEDCCRQTGIHAAGVVISPVKIMDIVPLYKHPEKGDIATQYEMEDAEKAGLVKMDFLGLTALTIIYNCLQAIFKDGLTLPNIDNLDYDDLKIYQNIFHTGNTESVFQFESDGMKKICEQTKPVSLEDLAALNALYRPGALDSGLIMIYIDRKNGKEEVTYDFESLKEVLENTHGVLVYQEQIMNTFRVLASYSVGEADLIRRSLGKKKLDEMEKQKDTFIDRAIKNGYKQEELEKLWEKILNYSSYCFNKAHSMAYSAISYQTAYLKHYYPVYFWATVLTNECNDPDSFKKYLDLVRKNFITILPPDINKSDLGFKVEDNKAKTIRYGLIGIKGVGEAVINAILEERNKKPFISLYDFLSRMNSHSVNKRSLEVFVKSGALDTLLPEVDPLTARSRLFISLESMHNFMDKKKKQDSKIDKKEILQETIFDFLTNDKTIEQKTKQIEESIIINTRALDKLTLLAYEKEAIGLYINGHPTDLYKPFLSYVDVLTILEIKNRAIIPYNYNDRNSKVNRIKFVAALVDVIFKYTKGTNQKFAVCTFEDNSERIKGYLWNIALSDVSEETLIEGNIFLIEGDLKQNKDFGDEKNISIYNIQSIDDLIKKSYKGIIFFMPEEHVKEEEIQELYSLIADNPGDCFVELEIIKPDLSKEKARIGDKYKITPSAKFINSAISLFKFCEVYPVE